VYEVYPGGKSRTLTDFEGRRLTVDAEAGRLTIEGAAARVTVRWRFAHPSEAAVNGQGVRVTSAADGASVEFRHQGSSTVTWK